MMYTTDVSISLISSSNQPGTYILVGNGMYDPDSTGTGHQPRGFDQLMAFYDHYVVTGVSLKAQFFNTSSSVASIAFVCPRDSYTASANFTDYGESSLTRTVQLGVEGTSASTKTIVYDLDVGRFLGRRDPLSDPELKGSTAANPTENVFFHIGAITPDLFTASAVLLTATLTFNCVLIEPKMVAAS